MPTAASQTVAFSSPTGLCPRNLQGGQQQRGGGKVAAPGGRGGRDCPMQAGGSQAGSAPVAASSSRCAPPHVMGPQQGEEDGAPHCMQWEALREVQCV